MDEDVGKDDFIGDFCIKFNSIRQGYRHFKLNNKYSKGVLFVGIKIVSIDKLRNPTVKQRQYTLIEDMIEPIPKRNDSQC
jgi:hypothetical protein